MNIQIPDLSGVPDYSLIECWVRYAGEVPKTHKVDRERWDRRIEELFRQDTVSAAEVTAVGAYFSGRFDRKRKQGRPANYERQDWLQTVADSAEAIRDEEQCTVSEAIERAIERDGRRIETPDNTLASAVFYFRKRRTTRGRNGG